MEHISYSNHNTYIVKSEQYPELYINLGQYGTLLKSDRFTYFLYFIDLNYVFVCMNNLIYFYLLCSHIDEDIINENY